MSATYFDALELVMLVDTGASMPMAVPLANPTPTTTLSSGQGYPFGSRKTPHVAGIRPTLAFTSGARCSSAEPV